MRNLISNNCSEGPGSPTPPPQRPTGENWIQQHPSFQAMAKGASLSEALATRPGAQSVLGGVLGGLSGFAFGQISPEEKPEKRRADMIRNAVYEGSMGAIAAPAIARLMPKLASWWGQESTPDYAASADVYKAKAAYSRAKLRLGSSFKKLPPEEQAEFLAAHDNYHSAVEGAIRTGQMRA